MPNWQPLTCRLLQMLPLAISPFKSKFDKMSSMGKALDQEMYHYFVQLDEAEKKSVVQMLKAFLKTRKKKQERISIEQYNKELEKSEKQIEVGNFTTQEELEKEMEKW